MKLCKDCKYCEDSDTRFSICSCQRNPTRINYTTGIKEMRWSHCNLLREDGFIGCRIMGCCGREGRFFEKCSLTQQSVKQEKKE